MTTYLSPAFLQQCFAMHRYDLVVKRLTSTGVVVSCRQCKLRHVVRLGPREAGESAAAVGDGLLACAAGHLADVCVQNVDVQRDQIELGCRQCRSADAFRLVECVTRQLTGGGAP